jgi:hypothetical protein
MKDFYAANKDTAGLEKEFRNFGRALDAYDKILEALAEWKNSNPALIPTYSRRVLTASSQLHASHLLLDQVLIALKKLAELPADHYDINFYKGKVEAVRYYLRNVTPHICYLSDVIVDADTSVLDVPIEAFNTNKYSLL